MSETVVTAGPADPNAPIAQKFYTVLTALAGLVSVASTFGMVTSEQAASLGQVASTGTAFVTALGLAIASFRTKKQLKNGTFEAAPVNPVQDAFQSINAIKDAVDQAVESSTAKVNEGIAIIQGATALPGIGQVFSGPVGDLIQAVQQNINVGKR